MAEASNGDKTEKASPQKLKNARKEGQIVRSREVASAVGLLASLKVFALLAPSYLVDFDALFKLAFSSLDQPGSIDNVWSGLFSGSFMLLIKMLLPLAMIPLMIILASLYPGGWIFSGKQLMPKFERMNPLSHFGRIFSAQHASEQIKAIIKVLILAAVLFYVSKNSLPGFFSLQERTLSEALTGATQLLFDALFSFCLVFILFAAIDLPLQIFLFMRKQKMSKQEQKDEYKTSEGRPEIKRRIRQIQQQIAQRSIRKAIPNADVIIVNPRHYAVALKYDENRAQAPFIVAKGMDEMAMYIRQLAEIHKIDIVPIPPLARAIYKTTQVNQQIPAPLFKAVAQVLTYVLQLKAFRSGGRRIAPQLPSDLGISPELAEIKEPA
ncbi:flagellar biosynthesis protein FlhB [Iodobacter sp.]|uniref:flagellar biosynthesis protein FlhB n=1 Tax=Iodobacter sp. TaxID=1915058 RepID=UPI0025E76D8C|nr:flagellar biosynthesis protein FlhB [Iodobacter sp.]